MSCSPTVVATMKLSDVASGTKVGASGGGQAKLVVVATITAITAVITIILTAVLFNISILLSNDKNKIIHSVAVLRLKQADVMDCEIANLVYGKITTIVSYFFENVNSFFEILGFIGFLGGGGCGGGWDFRRENEGFGRGWGFFEKSEMSGKD